VIDQGLRVGRRYDAYLILDQLPDGRVATLIGYNPRLSEREQEQAALECKRRVDSFAERGRNGPYAWQKRASDGGFQAWIGHRSPVSRTVWPRVPTACLIAWWRDPLRGSAGAGACAACPW